MCYMLLENLYLRDFKGSFILSLRKYAFPLVYFLLDFESGLLLCLGAKTVPKPGAIFLKTQKKNWGICAIVCAQERVKKVTGVRAFLAVNIYFCFILSLFSFWPCDAAFKISVSLEFEPGPRQWKHRASPNHWTAKKFPSFALYLPYLNITNLGLL